MSRFRIEKAFKGSPSGELQVRYRLDWCVGRPPIGQDIYLFVFDTDDTHLSALNFIQAEPDRKNWLTATLQFHNIETVKAENVIAALGALAQESKRPTILRETHASTRCISLRLLRKTSLRRAAIAS